MEIKQHAEMPVEVEVKFPVAGLDDLRQRLSSLPIQQSENREERDLYFAHPARDFSKTDEALRLRRVADRNYITYKGPKLDPRSKTRYELDLPLPEGEDTFRQWCKLLEQLGFSPVAEVIKKREKSWLQWGQWNVEISLDDVQEVGTFVELEIICPAEQLPSARDAVLRLGQNLGLEQQERRSYLELLLVKRRSSGELSPRSPT